MLSRGKLEKLIINGSKIIAEVSGLAGQKTTQIEYIQEYGFASLPPIGSSVLVGFVEDDPNNATILKVEHPGFRPELAAGEVAIYDNQGKLIKLKSGGDIEINTKIFTTKDVETTANMIISDIFFLTHIHCGVQEGAGQGCTDGPENE